MSWFDDEKTYKDLEFVGLDKEFWNVIIVATNLAKQYLKNPCPECGKLIQSIERLLNHIERIHD